jgi:hypothetical protein
MNKEVEILKLGTVMPVTPIGGSRVYDSSQFRKKTIMIVHNGGELFDYYISILKKNCDGDYNFLKSDKSIVGYPNVFRSSLLGNQPMETLKGLSDGDPSIGNTYTINNESWHTSKIEKIIDNCVLITKNSVYAIHNLSDLRDKKIKSLGI